VPWGCEKVIVVHVLITLSGGTANKTLGIQADSNDIHLALESNLR
jgi:hypothetical protein